MKLKSLAPCPYHGIHSTSDINDDDDDFNYYEEKTLIFLRKLNNK